MPAPFASSCGDRPSPSDPPDGLNSARGRNTPRYVRRLAALLFADGVGYSRLMRADEAAGYAVLMAHRRLIEEVVVAHAGRVAGGAGDSLLAAFASVEQAVRAAVALQEQLRRSNQRLPRQYRLEFRVGVHLGDVIDDGTGVYGHGVNLAARLQALAPPGGVAVSHAVYEAARHGPGLGFRPGGRQRVKHLAEPLPVFHYDAGHGARDRSWRRAARLALVAASALLGAALAFAM